MTGPIRDVTQGLPSLPTGGDADPLGLSDQGGPANGVTQSLSEQLGLGEQHRTSLDRFMAGADTLARFRDDPVSIPSSPVTQPGEVVRAGDVQADAGARLATPVGRGPDVTVGATVGAAGIDARLSMGAAAPGQPPWVNATVQVREPGRVDHASVNLRLIGSDPSTPMPPSLGSLAQRSGFVPTHGLPTTGMLTIRGAILEIAGPGGRTVLLATTDGGAVLRTGQAATQTSVFVRNPDGFVSPQAVAQQGAALPGSADLLGGLGLGAGSLAGMLAMLGGTEQQSAFWLGRPDGNPAAFPPSSDFKARWSDLRDRLSHDPAHIQRLEAVLYDCFAARFAELGVDLAARSPALRDVVWAMAVEHGPWPSPGGTDILSQVAERHIVAGLADADLIRALFDEQLRTDSAGRLLHYPELGTDALHQAVAERLANERQVALDRLAGQA